MVTALTPRAFMSMGVVSVDAPFAQSTHTLIFAARMVSTSTFDTMD